MSRMIKNCNKSIELVSTELLKGYSRNARTHSSKQIQQIARSIKDFGFNNPIMVDTNHTVIAGHGRLLAAKHLKLEQVPVIYLDHLTDEEKRAYIIADNKLAEKAGWDRDILKLEFLDLIEINPEFDLTLTAFETPEIDIILNDKIPEKDSLDFVPKFDIPKRVSHGDLWRLGRHMLYCGDSLKTESYRYLLGNRKADLIFTDPPYNVPIQGHVSGNGKVHHDEFSFASGEMSEQEFINFLKTIFASLTTFSKPGSIHYICMDWRHVHEITIASRNIYSSLKNICIWNKQLGAMGSLYRSQHEFIFVFKHGTEPHINNIELGKHGRNRTNVWDYPGVHVSNSHGQDLQLHPTAKPVQMISDAIVDCSKRGAVILDCFGGSGSTLIAAEKTKRSAYLIEFEPKYCDAIIFRYESLTGKKAERVKEGAHE